jgi:hypothetical protein
MAVIILYDNIDSNNYGLSFFPNTSINGFNFQVFLSASRNQIENK